MSDGKILTPDQIREDLKKKSDEELSETTKQLEENAKGTGLDAVASRIALRLFPEFDMGIREDLVLHKSEPMVIAEAASLALGDMAFAIVITLAGSPPAAAQIICDTISRRVEDKLNAHLKQNRIAVAKKRGVILPGQGMNEQDASIFNKVKKNGGRL